MRLVIEKARRRVYFTSETSLAASDTGRLVMLTLFINAGLDDFRIILRRRRWEGLRIEKSDLRRVGI